MASSSTIKDCLIGVGYTKQEVKDLFFENPDLEYDKLQAMKFLSSREKDLLRGKRNLQLQAIRIDALEKQIDEFPGSRKEALQSILTKSGVDANVRTTEGRYNAIRDQSYANLVPAMEQHKGTWGRLLASDKEFGVKVLREMHGTKTGDNLAAAAAREMAQITEQLRLRYNRAGGNIGKIADWNIVWHHDAQLVGKLTAADWIAKITPPLALDRRGLNKADELRMVLETRHHDIANGGLGKIKPGAVPPNVKAVLANVVGGKHRALHFKDVEGFLKYNGEFGTQDTFASMLAHIDTMSKDIAVMETLGPNPQMTFKYLKDRMMKETNNPNIADAAETTFKDVMGETMAQNKWAADRMGSLRAAVGAGKLKFAAISALSDAAFMGLESHFAGVPVMKTYARFIKQIFDSGDKRLAAHVAGVAEYAMDTLAQNARFMDITAGSGWANKAIALTIRGSGLEAWTNAAKRSFGLEFSAELGQHLSKSFDSIPGNLKRTLDIYGFTDADWKLLRSAKHTHKGTTYASFADIADEELAVKFGTMMRGEMRYAVPEPGWREQAFMKQGTKSGTIPGELLRTGMQFKSYPITLMMTWWARIARSKAMEGKLSRIGYAGMMMASTTMLGTAAVSLKDVAKGKTPPPMDDQKTYWRGFMQGGAAGPAMDFLAESATGKAAQFLMGPLGGEAEKLVTNLATNAKRVVEGKDTSVAHGLFNQVRGLTPGGWQVALGTRRLLADTLNELIDEDQFRENARRARTRARKEGQGITWEPGELTPEIMQ